MYVSRRSYGFASALIAAVVAVTVPLVASAATRQVNAAAGCSDATGSPSYCTINAAIVAAAAGDTIQIAAGTYAGTIASFSKSLTFNGSGSGPSGTNITKSITYTGTGPLTFSNLRITGGGTNLKIAGTGNFAGLTLTNDAFVGNGTGAHGVFIKQNGTVSNVAVTNCAFTGHGQSGFLIQTGTGPSTDVQQVVVTGSTFDANGEYGLRIDPRVTGLEVSSSSLTNNAIDGMVLLNANGAALQDLTITGNRNGILLIPLTAAQSISNLTLTNVNASNNTRFISGQYGSGLTLTGSTGAISQITIAGSTFSGNRIHGLDVTGAVSQVFIDCSTIANNQQHGIRESSSPSMTLKAEHVYWGCPTGPNSTGCSTVTGNVDFLPFRSSPSAICNPVVDLRVTKTASPNPVAAGGNLEYTLTAINDGPDPATGVVLTDPLPTGVTFVSASSGCALSGTTVICTIGDLASGAQAARTIQTTAPTSPGSITNTATIDGNEANDPNPANDSASAVTTVESGAETLPPDPATIAPPIDPTKVTTVYESTRFLYEATPRIQTAVAPGTIERKRAAVVRGRVITRAETGLGGVAVTIADHPEFGRTLTRADGWYDLAVNGGGPLRVHYEKNGYLKATRPVNPGWNAFALVDDLVMIPFDGAVTAVALPTTDVAVARGNAVADEDGMRRATIIFAEGTSAAMVHEDGSESPMSSMAVRATEYTVGPLGPATMPAPLPPQVGYTYCVELSADEAVAAGATSVALSKPASLYVENFLDFPTGEIVPVGYYDYSCASWVPSPNGRVVQIMAIEAGRAYLDIDGDGGMDDSDELIGTTIRERETLAQLYGLGRQLWRVPVDHFTPWDTNWGFAPPPDATDPYGDDPPSVGTPTSCSIEAPGSIIECESQTLRESLEVAGTPFHLNYNSARVQGRTASRTIHIVLSGDEVPASLQSIELQVNIAGVAVAKNLKFTPGPNRVYDIEWTQTDPYGRMPQGRTGLSVLVGYTYKGHYYKPGELPLAWEVNHHPNNVTGDMERRELTIWRDWSGEVSDIGIWDSRGLGLGGWTIDAQHFYDHSSATLYGGDGTTRSVRPGTAMIRTVAGNGSSSSTGDGGLARNATLDAPACIAADRDGSVYVGESGRVRRISRDGQIETIAGNGSSTFNGDGISALSAGISPIDLAFGPDGSLYIADEDNRRVRKVKNGIITTVAGNGQEGVAQEGISATSGPVTPHGIVVSPDNTLYIADREADVIYGVKCCGGHMWRVAGSTEPDASSLQDGAEARWVRLDDPSSITISPQGDLYFSSLGNAVWRISPEGRTHGVIGAEYISVEYGNSIPATPGGLAFVGETLVSAHPTGNRVRTMTGDRNLLTLAGEGPRGFGGDGGFANAGRLAAPLDITASPDGKFYFCDTGNDRIRALESPFPKLLVTETGIPSADGSAIYVFDQGGRHQRTLDALLGTELQRFAYDSAGYMISMTDANDNVTTIERNGAVATGIVAPGGQRTSLETDSNGFLSAIVNPAAARWQLHHHESGLLTLMIDPRQEAHTFGYDTLGRLTSDQDAAGTTTVAMQGNFKNYTVTKISPENRATSIQVASHRDGAEERIYTDPSGVTAYSSVNAKGETSMSEQDGTTRTSKSEGDPRFGLQAALRSNSTLRRPNGSQTQLLDLRSFEFTDPDDPFSPIATATMSTGINGNVTQSFFNAATREVSVTSPMGRSFGARFDDKSRVELVTQPGVTPASFTYDGRGRMTAITHGPRVTQFGYDARNRLTTITDPLSRTLTLGYDDADRVTERTFAGQTTHFTYDALGSLTSVTPPGRGAHLYTESALGQTYTPPDAASGGSIQYTYNRDRQVTQIMRADSTVDFIYGDDGRLSTLSTPRGLYHYNFDLGRGRVTSIDGPDGSLLEFGFDGPLFTSQTWSNGAVNGQIYWDYDGDMRVVSETVCGITDCAGVNFDYDSDSLLTFAGGLTLEYDGANGFLLDTRISLENENGQLREVSDHRQYNDLGEVSAYTASYGEASMTLQYGRDAGGRIEQVDETSPEETVTREYGYDAAGRLVTAKRNGVVTTTFTYDANGNRLTRTSGAQTDTATYDGQDRLLSFGGATYTYTPGGDLATKTTAEGVTEYRYDALGNLLGVTLPNGSVIEYVIDPNNRRIGRRVDGVLTHGWLYDDGDRVSAQLDGDGHLQAHFTYATRANVPDMMTKEGRTYRFIADERGSPRRIVDVVTGEAVQRLEYDEFGNVTVDTNPGFQPFGFAGGLYDAPTGLTRFGFRDYDAATGRWTTKDPIEFAGGDTNLYGYALADPINVIDITGLAGSKLCNNETAKKFVKDRRKAFDKWAKGMNIEDERLLLALSAHESSWGQSPGASDGRNNIFGIGHAPNAEQKAAGKHRILYKFKDEQEGMTKWQNEFGSDVNGAKNIDDFISKLQNRKKGAYNSEDPKWADKIKETYKNVVTRCDCP